MATTLEASPRLKQKYETELKAKGWVDALAKLPYGTTRP